MSYSYSSAYPRAPNSTPQLSAPLRPPIHNPYDKFTQPQFDEWIGGITSALRRALGQEEEETLTSHPEESREGQAHPVSDTDEDNVEDSFAEWKAMRVKEKGKMRATEDEQDSEYGGSQKSHGGSGVGDHTAGDTPDDAIELLSDDEGEELDDREECNDEDHDGRLVESFSPVESDGEVEQPYVGGSKHTIPPKPHGIFANTTGREAIEISDGETENQDQADDSSEAENVLFGWGQDEEGECQQPPDVRDPWELPKSYAEDLYTGGPLRETDRLKLSPSHLMDYFNDIDPQLRPSSAPISQPTVHNLAEGAQGSTTPATIPPTADQVSNNDDEASLYDEDVLEPNTTTTAPLRGESTFVSFTALNQPSDLESERGEPEVLYISDNDGGEVSGNDGEGEDEFDDDGPIPLGTSDLEVPAERGLEDGGEEFDELEDDDEPVVEVTTNLPYGYYGLDASSVTGSGGLDDETRTVGPPSDAPKGEQSEPPGMEISQESASLVDPHGLVPLPAATAFIDIDHQVQSEVSVVVDEVVGIEDTGSAEGDSAVDNTVLADGAILTANEVEEVLRDAFADTDQSVPTQSAQEGATLTSRTIPLNENQATRTLPKPDTTPEIPLGEGLHPNEPATKDGENLIGSPPSTVKDQPPNPQEEQKSLPFVMPLVANPNVRDPMSAPWSPVQSGPPTPVASVAYLPAVTKFKRDNQLAGVAHSSSGLFTPLEGSGSSSPSPSDTATPEDQPGGEDQTEGPGIDGEGKDREGRATSVVVSPIGDQCVKPEAILTNPPEDGNCEEIPRLQKLPDDTMDPVITTPTATKVFFQPVESNGNVEGLRARSEADPDDSQCIPVIVADSPREEEQCQGVRGLDDSEPWVSPADATAKDLLEVTEADEISELMGNNSPVAPGTVTDDDDASSICSSSPDGDQTPRLKVSEIPAPAAEDSLTTRAIHPEIQPSSPLLSRTRENSDVPAEAPRNLRKRKRSVSIPISPEPSGPECVANGKASDVATASLGNGGYEEAGNKFIDEEPRNDEENDSDSESFASSLVAPRNADLTDQDDSRASSVVLEQPLLPQGRIPVSEDAPVFHGHGKFKAGFQALKIIRQASENRAQGLEREEEGAKERRQEKEGPVAAKAGSRKPFENDSMDNKQAKRLPPLVLPGVSTQPSLPSASTSQSPMTPTSALPPSSPTVITTEVTTPPHQEQAVEEPMEPDREPAKKPSVKTVKRTTSRKRTFFEPKSTRSQCRYRKISVPREEDGPRVTFCVPQCSLNDKELMEEEDITDDGLATVRDFERLWDHVEEQDLSPYLIGVIRQLVGLDLLRENEVYYLPTDEEIKQMEKRHRREERRRNRKSVGGAANMESSSIAGRSGSIPAAIPTSQPSLSQIEKGRPGPPSSFAESVSTVSTRSRVDNRDPARSISGDEMKNGERGGRTKRRRTGKERDGNYSRSTPSIREDSAAPSTAGSPAPSQPVTDHVPTRRSRRTLKAVPADAQAYRPPLSSGESSEGELENAKARRKSARGGTKGLKRRRTGGAGDSLIPSAAGGVGDHDAPLSPQSTRSKRAKIDEK